MKKITLVLLLGALVACAPASDSVQVRIALPQMSRATLPEFAALTYPPMTLTDFQCYMLNVYGPGIGSELGDNGPGTAPGCPYRGITSNLVATNSTTLSLTVPAGPSRVIQVIGFAAQGATACPGGTLRDFENLHPFTGTPNAAPPYSVNQLGIVMTDLYKDKSVTIKNTYSGNNGASYPFSCPFNGAPPMTGVPAQLAFSTQPAHGSTYTVAFTTQPVVQARDGFGVLAPSYTGSTISLSAYSDPGCTSPVNALISPTATITNGVANFSGVQYNYASSLIYIRAVGPSINSVCSILVTTI